MTALPYWNSTMNMKIPSWFPFGVDYIPVSVNAYHSGILRRIAALSLRLDSEFLCLTSTQSGSTGNLLRESMFVPGQGGDFDLGFTMFFGYSPFMEELLSSFVSGQESVEAGISFCCLWDREILRETFKAIVIVSGDPFFPEDDFLALLVAALEHRAPLQANLPFFAEKFGYRRFFIPYETDNLVNLEISRLLYEMEFEETRKWVGPSPEIRLPLLFGLEIPI